MIWLEGQTFTKFSTHGLLWTDDAANLLMFTIVAAVFAAHRLGLHSVPHPGVLWEKRLQTVENKGRSLQREKEEAARRGRSRRMKKIEGRN
jgi:hypothetical protein